LTESWKEDCNCYESFSENDLKRIEDTASCAISIHSSSLTIRDRVQAPASPLPATFVRRSPGRILGSHSKEALLRYIPPVPDKEPKREFKVGDKIRVNLHRGKIEDAVVKAVINETDGVKLQVDVVGLDLTALIDASQVRD